MKWVLVVCAIIMVMLVAYFLFGSEDTFVNYPPHEGPIVAFGDSLVKGVGAPEGQDFVSLLSVKIGEPVINLGVPGDTTADGLVRLGEVTDLEPRIVIVLLGGNDYLKKIPKAETFTNLKSIVTTLQSDGILVVLLGIRGGLLNDRFEEDFEQLAEETGSVYVPNVLDGIFGKSALMSDTVHPNSEGYKIIGDKVHRALKDVLQ